MHKEFGSKGLVLINISLDSDKAKFSKFVKSNKMNWYNTFDGKGWKAELFVGRGWNSIPRKFLLDPTGKVVADTDMLRDSGSMKQAIEECLKKTPPTKKGSPFGGGGDEELAKADKMLAKKDYAKALKAYEKIVKADKNSEAGKAAAKKIKAMKSDKAIVAAMAKADADKNAPGLLKMADQLAGNGNTEQAKKYYQQVIDRYPDSSYAAEARQRLEKLGG